MGNIVGIVLAAELRVEVYTNVNNTLDYVGMVFVDNLEKEHIMGKVKAAATAEGEVFEVVQIVY